MHRKLAAASLRFKEGCKLASQNWLQPFCESGAGKRLTSFVIANGLALAAASSAITWLSQSIRGGDMLRVLLVDKKVDNGLSSVSYQ